MHRDAQVYVVGEAQEIVGERTRKFAGPEPIVAMLVHSPAKHLRHGAGPLREDVELDELAGERVDDLPARLVIEQLRPRSAVGRRFSLAETDHGDGMWGLGRDAEFD